MYGQVAIQRQCIRLGAAGSDVSLLQTKLRERGYGYEGTDPIDPSLPTSFLLDVTGTFDANTDTALRALQMDSGLTSDGISGPQTWSKLGQSGAPCGGGGSSSGGGSGGGAQRSPVPSKTTALTTIFYEQKWFYWTVSGLAVAAIAAILLLPKKGKK